MVLLPSEAHISSRQVSWLTGLPPPSFPEINLQWIGFVSVYSSGGCSGFSPLSLLNLFKVPKTMLFNFKIYLKDKLRLSLFYLFKASYSIAYYNYYLVLIEPS